MRIGVFLETLHDSGGGFQVALSTVETLLRQVKSAHSCLVFTPFEENQRLLSKLKIDSVRYRHGGFRLIDRWSTTVVGNAILRRLRRLGFRRLGRHLDALLDDYDIDLALFTEMGDSVLRIGDHPFIVTVMDLDHRDHPDFPEHFSNRFFERRERSIAITLQRAMAVITNCSFYADKIAQLYNVGLERIVVLPFVPSVSVRRYAADDKGGNLEEVKKNYALPDRYVFYPAYFSFHKNHLYLLEGLAELKKRHGITMHAVFCGGGDPGDQENVELQVRALGLSEQVHFLGLVPDEDVPALYQGALALVMPVYYAPTNLPPLEAVTLGCPVVYSDFPSFREQLGDAALYCDLANPASVADHLVSLIENPDVVKRLRQAGYRLADELAKFDYARRLTPVLDKYAYVSRRWKWPENLIRRK
jgi:glycosyltransferase involved in cell wall biosynthesis